VTAQGAQLTGTPGEAAVLTQRLALGRPGRHVGVVAASHAGRLRDLALIAGPADGFPGGAPVGGRLLRLAEQASLARGQVALVAVEADRPAAIVAGVHGTLGSAPRAHVAIEHALVAGLAVRHAARTGVDEAHPLAKAAALSRSELPPVARTTHVAARATAVPAVLARLADNAGAQFAHLDEGTRELPRA